MTRNSDSKWQRAVERAGLTGALNFRPDWIGRALPRAGVLSPEDTVTAIAAGRVAVQGVVASDPLTLIRPGDTVSLDGQTLDLTAPTHVLAFHKPEGCVVSTQDVTGVPTVFDLLRAALDADLRRFGWYAPGRLDRNTTGLLLFSNDERLVAHATRPATHLPKRYLARVHRLVTDDMLEPLRLGVTLDDGPTRPATAAVRGPYEVEITLTEGRFHQVKKMLATLDLRVRTLHREAVGDVELGHVPVGSYRLLTPEEITIGLRYRPS